METFTHPVSKDRELLISRMRAGCDPAVVKINTTSGEEQSKDCIVCHFVCNNMILLQLLSLLDSLRESGDSIPKLEEVVAYH